MRAGWRSAVGTEQPVACSSLKPGDHHGPLLCGKGAPRMATARTRSFGELLRRHRLAAGLTLDELAARAGLSANGIGALERGERRAPHRETVSRLADALQLPPTERAV